MVGGLAWSCVVLLLAGALRGRYDRSVERRERAREAARRREVDAVTAERLRIARELHDVLAHSLSAITVQSGVGLHLIDRDVEQARSALTQIRSTSRDALDEVRAVLGVVRADPGAPSPDARDLSEAENPGDPRGSDNEVLGRVPRVPTWTLEALPQLVDGFVTSAGSRARLDVSLAPADAARVPPHVAGVAYRVVQESLTNVRRHAADAREVSVVVGVPVPGELRVVVSDDGPGPSTPAPERGYGLRGMRERVEGAGGTLRTGTRGDGGRGFEVDARVPLPPLATTPDLSERGAPIPASRSDKRSGRGDVSGREGSIAPPGSDSSRSEGAG
jgi:signal transduction histidine kinase